jgi:hypothetical protein
MKKRIAILSGIIRIYDFFRYNLPRFIKNFWVFRKDIYYFRPDIENSHLWFLHTSLTETLKMHMNNHIEGDIVHDKIIQQIQRAIVLLTIHINDTYLDEAKKILRLKYNNTFSMPIYDPAIGDTISAKNIMLMEQAFKLEERNWEELWQIIKGQNLKERGEPDNNGFPENFNGMGINHWGD